MRVVWTPWQLIWMVLQLGWRLGQLQVCPERPGSPLTFLPAQLTVPEGGEATFFCSYPNMTAPTMLNWYRSSPSNQSVKLAAFPKDHGEPARDQRFSITQLAGKQAFRLHISTVLRNDSNTYYCGAINLPPETQITESPCAELTVTDRVSESPTTHPSPAPGPKGQFQALVISITSVLVGVLVLLLLAWVLATVLPRGTQGASGARSDGQPASLIPPAVVLTPWLTQQLGAGRRDLTPASTQATYGSRHPPHDPLAIPPRDSPSVNKNPHTQSQSGTGWVSGSPQQHSCIGHSEKQLTSPSFFSWKKEDPSATPVFTVDYGELDFQRREKTPEPPGACLPEQTEYATIVFPDGVSHMGRRGSADGLWGPRPLRPEDTHCSWPL